MKSEVTCCSSTAGARCAIRVAVGNIVDIKADVLVNAANNMLQLGGGVAGAFRAAGGAALQQECDAALRAFLKAWKGQSIPDGLAVLTSAAGVGRGKEVKG